jgi:hypothetical protein
MERGSVSRSTSELEGDSVCFGCGLLGEAAATQAEFVLIRAIRV